MSVRWKFNNPPRSMIIVKKANITSVKIDKEIQINKMLFYNETLISYVLKMETNNNTYQWSFNNYDDASDAKKQIDSCSYIKFDEHARDFIEGYVEIIHED
jgi:hypothetical protein